MRKEVAIIFLAVVMAVSFFGLIVLQAKYIKETADLHEDEFNESVHHCLRQTVKQIEEEETMNFLYDALGKENESSDLRNMFSRNKSINIQNRLNIAIDTSKQSANSCVRVKPKVYLSSKSGKSSIHNTSQLIQNKLRERYKQERALLDDILIRLLCDNYTTPIRERINFAHIGEVLDREMINAGLDLTHAYCVMDRDGTMAYKSNGYAPTEDNIVYTQPLFPNDPTPSGHYMKVYFPERTSYIYSMMTLTVPSLVLSGLLLFTFIFSLFLISREKKLSQMRTDFMNNMTHELKTPVSSISLASQMLSDHSITKSEKMIDHLTGVISDETRRLSLQIDKVLQMSILERETAALKLKETDINDLVITITSNFAIKVESKGGTIDTNADADYPFAMVDEVHFTNIVYNLLDNALKYTAEVPHLEVNTWDSQNSIFISVKDNGIGIKKADQKKIFEKFFRVSTGSVHNVKGFGLGLAYVKKVVTDHGGKIKCESEIGKGTTFIIEIPKMKEESVD